MRSNINVNSSLKLFEVYSNFNGGINTEQSNELLKDNELTVMQNVDLVNTSSIKKRTGRYQLAGFTGTSYNMQGLFNYRSSWAGETRQFLVMANAGYFYISGEFLGEGFGVGGWYAVPITYSGSPFQFQTEYCVEAVQYKEWLYVATGTRLVRIKVVYSSLTVSTITAEVVTPATTTFQQVMYQGMNALADTPAAMIVDNDAGTVFRAAGIIPTETTTGRILSGQNIAVSKPFTLTAYYERLTTTTTPLKYKWEYKLNGVESQVWAAVSGAGAIYGTGNKSITFTPEVVGSYDFRVYIQEHTGSTTVTTSLSGFEVVQSPPNYDLQIPDITSTGYNQLQRCTRCLVYKDQLMLYNPVYLSTEASLPDLRDRLYISDIAKFDYFPQSYIWSFNAAGGQSVRKVLLYRTSLLVFTQDTVQMLQGDNPSNFSRLMINTQLGAHFYGSVQVVQNQVFFFSKQGLMAIQPNPYAVDNLNVVAIDTQIKSQLATDFLSSANDTLGRPYRSVFSVVHNEQYWLYSPFNVLYRYHYKRKVWTKDTFTGMTSLTGSIYPVLCYFANPFSGTTVTIAELHNSTGKFLIQDSNVYSDDGTYANSYTSSSNVYTNGAAYTMEATTKFFDFSAGYNFKKLKRFYVMAKHFNSTTNLYVTIQADTQVVLTPESGQAVTTLTPNGDVTTWVVTTTPNIKDYVGTVIGSWIVGTSVLGDFPTSVSKTSVRAKARRISVTIQHSDTEPCEVYGFGFEFREKRP